MSEVQTDSSEVDNNSTDKKWSDSPRIIFVVWAICVVLINICVPYEKRQILNMVYSRHWPPYDIMAQNVDSHNRLVVTIVSYDYLELADNFIASLERNGVSNFVIVPKDQKSFETLREVYGHHVLPPMPTPMPILTDRKEEDAEAGYVDPSFQAHVQSHINILHAFINAGYTIFYSEIGSVWRANAFEEVDKAMPFMSIDSHAFFIDGAEPFRRASKYSAVHMYLKPSISTINFLENWFQHDRIMVPGSYQESLNDIINEYESMSNLSSLRLSFQDVQMNAVIGSREKFPPGCIYFSGNSSKQSTLQQNTVIVQTNFQRNYQKKMELLKKYNLWDRSRISNS